MGRTKEFFIESGNRADMQAELSRGSRLRMLADGAQMRHAIDASKNCTAEDGKKKPTPFVGAAIVLNGELLGTAYRGEIEPGEHAEYTLLERKLKDVDLTGAVLYSTLEPCTKRNPPKIECAQRIIDRRIGTVIIGTLDPNPDVCGVGELRLRRAGIRIGRFSHEFMEEIEQLNKEFSEQFPLDSKMKRSASEKTDPVKLGELFGPNGHPIGYDDEGNKVEWIPDDENPGQTWAMMLRRNDDTILEMYNELWDKVWWNRHMIHEHDHGHQECSGVGEMGCEKAARVVKTYGRENLGWNDIDWGLLQGRLSAISWVMGSEWHESLDT